MGRGLVLPQFNAPGMVLPFLRSEWGVDWGGAGGDLGRGVKGGREYMIMSKARQKLCLVIMTRSDSTGFIYKSMKQLCVLNQKDLTENLKHLVGRI